MAVNKTTKAAEAAESEQTVKDTAGTVKTDSGANNEATEGKETAAGKEKKEEEKEELTLVYIGPTLPAGKLKCNKIFIGTMEEIEKELEAVLQEYPLVKKLLVPVNKVAEKKDKARTKGNILNKYYSDLVSGIAANEAKEG